MARALILCLLIQFRFVAAAQSFESPAPAKHSKALWLASVAALAASHVADTRSSWNKDEANRLLAGSNGRFGAKGAAIKTGVNALWIAGQVAALRRNPAHRTLAIINFAAASVLGALAWRNATVPGPPH